MIVDVVMLSDGKTLELRQMTQNAIDSIHASNCSGIVFNVTVFEKQFGIAPSGQTVVFVCPELGQYAGYFRATTYLQVGEFNYNRYMNEGTRMGSAEWVVWANNDIRAENDFMSHIIYASDLLGISSWCCYDPKCHDKQYPLENRPATDEGFTIRRQICGWFIVARRIIWDIIGGLDESHSFWYSDNSYAEQLQRYNFRHALNLEAVVKHLHSKTLFTLPLEQQLKFTEGTIPE